MKKEPLSIIAVKALLAVLIFAGVGTIIVGGGLLIRNYSKVSNNKLTEIIVKERQKEKLDIKIGNAEIDDKINVAEIQKNVDKGHQPWRLSPDMVLLTVKCYGFTDEDLSDVDFENAYAEPGKRIYQIQHKANSYLVTLTQPIVGEDKIWIISKIEEITDWKTYRNEEYGFEINYPKIFGVKESLYGIVCFFTQQEYDPEMFFFVQDRPMALLFTRTFVVVPRENAMNSSATLDSSEDIVINSIHWQKEVWSLQADLKAISYYTKYKDKYYTIAIGMNQSSYSEKEKIISQMLSTFRFIEPEEIPVDETSDWKTYQEKPFQDLQPHKPWGFEFKYPKEFVLKQGDHLDFPSGSFLKAHRSGAGVSSAKVAISVILPQSVYPDTNFQSAWLTIAYDPDIANLPNCQELERNQIVEKMTESQVINGVTWYKGITGSAALGTAIKSKVYHTLHNNMCYEVSLHLATTNIGNFDPALGIKPVDESEVWSKLESVLSTFRFLE